MFENHTIAVVIPSYKVSKYLKNVVRSIPDFVDFIIVVDDRCPEKSYTIVDESEKIFIVRHESNLGVGGAVVVGDFARGNKAGDGLAQNPVDYASGAISDRAWPDENMV